ncbi:MAG TPA: FtsQ-type POTRA domain-containing protein [Dehalococcoidia bacterium]|nr:FtsQ-type POTRA domain-containing protein [Dehalococcoidia bacterium]
MRGRDASSRRSRGERGPIRPYVLLGQREQLLLRRRRWRRLLLGLALVTTLAAALGLYLSPLLRVQAVEVRGTQVLRAEDVAALADLEGKSMLRLPLKEAERRISRLDMVKAVQVRPEFPQRVVITVQERQPWGYWQRGGENYVVDDEGVVLRGVSPSQDVPTIIDATGGGPLKPGERVSASAISLAVRLRQELPQSLGIRADGFRFTAQDGLVVSTDAGYQVVLGDGNGLDYKLRVWQAVQRQFGPQALKGRVLDLRFGDRPALR